MRFQQSSDSVARSLSFSMMISISRSLIHATCPWRSLFSSNERNLRQIDLSGPGSDTKSLDFFLRSDLTSRLRAPPPPHLPESNAPSARSVPKSVWTGNEMIVWGGFVSTGNYLNTGGRYDPATD